MKLKEIRIEKGLTQAKVATLLGINVSTYRSYENKYCDPGVAIIVKLSLIFGITTDYLLSDSNDDYLFEPATLPKTEIQKLYDRMSPQLQDNMLIYANGLILGASLRNENRQVSDQYSNDWIDRNKA